MKVNTFLSYADNDKIIAGRLKEKLDDFDVFLSHEDIHLGDDWLTELQKNIKNCEIFIVLLSQNFHNANFTNHEVGYAIACNKRIFAISIDHTQPYGFMEPYQAKYISSEINDDDVKILSHELMLYAKDGTKMVDSAINDLKKSTNFRDANSAARTLSCYSFYTKKQINDIAHIYLKNYEVSNAWTSRPFCERIFNDYEFQLDPVIKKIIRNLLVQTTVD